MKTKKSKVVWQFTNQTKLTAMEFVRYFEKKVKGTIRKYHMPIGKVGKKGLKAEIINRVIERLPKRKGKLSTENLDDISNNILNIVMYGNGKKLHDLMPKNQPLYFLSNKEIQVYAKIKGIRGELKRSVGKIKQIDDFLQSLEKKNADIRLNVVQALLKAEN